MSARSKLTCTNGKCGEETRHPAYACICFDKEQPYSVVICKRCRSGSPALCSLLEEPGVLCSRHGLVIKKNTRRWGSFGMTLGEGSCDLCETDMMKKLAVPGDAGLGSCGTHGWPVVLIADSVEQKHSKLQLVKSGRFCVKCLASTVSNGIVYAKRSKFCAKHLVIRLDEKDVCIPCETKALNSIYEIAVPVALNLRQ